MRAVRMARSVGRPSRLKKPPGIFPAAYMRSSTSTVSGKKSAPSRGSVRPCAVALLGELPRLEADLLATDLDGDGDRDPCGVLGLDDTHLFCSSTVRVEG